MITKTGRCLCGAVTFEADLADIRYAVCHCGMCRRWAGGPFFAKDTAALRVTQGTESVVSFRSSDWAERAHCGTCGSSLWYLLRPKNHHIIAVGTLDDQSDMTLSDEIYIDHQPPGYRFAGELGRMTEAEFLAAFSGNGAG